MPHPRPTSLRTVTLGAIADLLGERLEMPMPGTTPGDLVVGGVSLSSRSVQPGDLYAALPGARAHGADFAGAAAAAGAVAVLTDPQGADRLQAADVVLPTLVVADPRGALGEVSQLVYGTDDLPVRMLGITGTNGKTTTAYLVESALRALGRRTGLIGTIETRIGQDRIPSVRTTPEMTDLHAMLAVMAERGIDDCVMEVSSHALALHRVDQVRYDIALFTNLSQDHLDFHGSMEDYFLAKASLFTPSRSARGVVCVDDAWGRRLADEASVPVTTLTSRPEVEATWRVEAAGPGPDFLLDGPPARLELRSALPGDFNRVNTAMAAVALIELGHTPAEVAAAIHARPTVPGRMERVTSPEGGPTGVVDFAHTPDAVAAALAALRAETTGALVAVLGAGGSRDPGKRPGMGEAAARHADVVVVTDDNPREEDPGAIRDAVASGAHTVPGAHVEVVADRTAGIARAVELAAADGPGSTVAVLGKGHETGQEVRGVTHPYDDREVLAAALAEHATRNAR